MTATEPKTDKTTVTVTIDGKVIEAEPGALLIKVAQEHGVYIPRFCWHERMKPVGMCRMCLVEVEGARGLPPACTTPVTDGMVCHTTTDAVKAAQDGVLELLLINHPLDCPVCDRGGECPLQDTTLAFGPGESRFVEEKRHWEKPIPISGLVLLDRERCIQCSRCTRFADEIAGDPLITFVERGGHTQVLNFPDHPFASYFSGNTVQICPVGALTAQAYRFKARPWDLATVETSCTSCSVQCRGALQSTSNRLVRLLGVDSDPVNHGWLCDKGRYGFEYVHSDQRVRSPRLAGRDATWPEALDAASDLITNARSLHGAGSVAMIGGAHGTNEDAYAWARLMKGVVGTDHVDAQVGDGLPAEVVLGMPRAQIDDLDSAAAIVLLAPDLKEELPVLFLRVRRAAVELGVPLIDISSAPHGLSREATHGLIARPAEQAAVAGKFAAALGGAPSGDAAVDAAAAAVRARSGRIVVVLGRPSLAERPEAVLAAAAALAEAGDVAFLSALRRGNVHGALEMGLAPGLLPGRVSLAEGRDRFVAAWGGVPEATGSDCAGILSAAAEGRIQVLVLVGADPLNDFPDRDLAQRALASVPAVVRVDAFEPAGGRQSDVFLPVTLFGEKSGTLTNLEGRVQRVGAKISPEGTTMDDWRIAAELALRLGSDFDLESPDEVTDEIARLAPALVGASAAVLNAARDGVVLPVADHAHEIRWRRGTAALLEASGGFSWDPIRPDAHADAAAEVPEVPAAQDAAAEQDGAGESEGSDESGGSGESPVAAPAIELVSWSGDAPTPDVPARDAYALRLVTGRTLYDGGRLVSQAPAIEQLAGGPVLLVSSADLNRIGVTAGTEVKAVTNRGSVVVPVRAERGMPEGVARFSFTADGAGVAALIDHRAPVTDVRVETLS